VRSIEENKVTLAQTNKLGIQQQQQAQLATVISQNHGQKFKTVALSMCEL
jgi:hypothetical protein